MKTQKAVRLVSFVSVLLLASPEMAMASGLTKIAAKIFSPGGIGFPIVTLMFLAIGSSLAERFSAVVGKGHFGSFISAISLLSGVGMVATAAWGALLAIAKVMGLA